MLFVRVSRPSFVVCELAEEDRHLRDIGGKVGKRGRFYKLASHSEPGSCSSLGPRYEHVDYRGGGMLEKGFYRIAIL